MTICNELNCKNNALYNLIGNKPKYCRNHKTDAMIDVSHKKCFKCNKKRPSFGLEGDKPTHCSDCRTDIMIDVSHKKCIKCNIKNPSFGLEGEKATHCRDCKTDVMIDVCHKKCIKCNIKNPNFGLEPGKATHCSDCMENNMYDVINKKCIKCNITTASFGLENGIRTHCRSCKEDNMQNLVNKKCKTELCETRENPSYEGYCAYCYGNLFPDSPTIKNYKTKERLVVDYIRTEYPDYTWKFDKIIDNACSKRRPDIFLDLGYQVIIIEVDENQHSDYDCSCENKRLMELSQDIGHRPLIFIRFNPDKYFNKNNKKITSCFSIPKKTGILKVNNNKKWNERLNNLKNQIDYWNKNKTDKTVEIIQLYYDEN